MWWLNTQGNLGKDVSKNVFYADGFGGNYIVVDQEHDLVIVVRWLDSGKIADFVKHIQNAVQN
jgi:CubicO group peptidase (beta-lactamase class C family)